MPNGSDRNLMRLYEVLNGFRGRYGRWPSIVRLGPVEHHNLVTEVLSPEGRALLESRIRLVVEKDIFAAADDTGDMYKYLSGGVGASYWIRR